MSRRCVPVAGFVLAGMLSLRLDAQPAPTPQHYVTVASYQVDFSKVDSLSKLVRAYSLPIADEAKKMGVLLEYRVLIHYYAGRDNVVILRKFNSWGAIQSDTSYNAAFRRLVPDSLKRRAINDAFSAIFGSNLHHDEIYAEVVRP